MKKWYFYLYPSKFLRLSNLLRHKLKVLMIRTPRSIAVLEINLNRLERMEVLLQQLLPTQFASHNLDNHFKVAFHSQENKNISLSQCLKLFNVLCVALKFA